MTSVVRLLALYHRMVYIPPELQVSVDRCRSGYRANLVARFAVGRTNGRRVYVFQFVFDAVTDVIIKHNLKDVGLF